jgi:hypothetical protein
LAGIGRKHPVSGSGRDENGDVEADKQADEETKEKGGVEWSNGNDEKREEMLDLKEHHEQESC